MKIWCLDYRDHIYTDAAIRNLTQFRGMKFFRGSKLAGRFPSDVTVEIRSRHAPSDFFCAGVFWIISSRLRSILESDGVEAEFFLVSLVNKNGNLLDGPWWCINPTRVLDWFDWSKSEYIQEQNFATEIKSIAVKQEVIGNVPLAVAERTIPVLVAVRDSLAASIIQNGCTGIVFREPHEWQNPVNPVK